MLLHLFHMFFSAYAFGLVIYVILTWIQHPQAIHARQILGKLYLPLLIPLRKYVKPLNIGGAIFDITPIILYFVIIIIGKISYFLISGVILFF